MSIPVEAVYNYHYNGSIELDSVAYAGYYWNPQSFGGMSQDPAPGDIIIAMIACRTDNEGTFSPNLRIADDSGNERTDWVQHIDNQFDDDGSGFAALDPSYSDPHVFPYPLGGYYAVALFTKVWTADDDPATYNAYFTGFNSDGSGTFSEFVMGMYCIHGGDGALAVTTNEGGAETTPADFTFSKNFGDGSHSWGQRMPSDVTDGFGTWGFSPGQSWAYVEGTGANVYAMCMFGSWAFFQSDISATPDTELWFFDPLDFDFDWGSVNPTTERDPLRSFTIMLQDVLVADVIRISGNTRRFRHIEVT